MSGASTSLDRKEKPAVISLREIADGLVDVDGIKKNIVRSIKNRGTAESIQTGSEVAEMVEEEISAQSLVLKDTAFVDENIAVDD